MRRSGNIVLAVAVVVVAVLGCTERAERIDLDRVPPPPGGSAETVTVLESGETTHVVAAMQHAVFVRSPGREGWTRHRAEWPSEWKQTAASPLAGVLWSPETFNFPTRQRFTAHAGRLWMLTRHQPSGRPTLLVSADRGRSWSTASLPTRFRSGAANHTGSGPLSQFGARMPLRLASRDEQGLYLLDKNRVWRAEFSEEGDELEGWNPIERSGPAGLATAPATALPTVVRNYLPAAGGRPYELLTVFGDRLYVYRRHRKADDWILVSTLPTVDMELRAPAGTESIYLLAPEALYRSTERGEQWQKLTLTRAVQSQPRNRAVAFVPVPDAPAPSPPAIVVGTHGGAIYRSADGGASWSRVRPPDPDGRSITGLAVDADNEQIWASTAGEGMLVSTDSGRSWSRANKDLLATRPLAIEVGLNDELVLGTRAGLFRLTGAPEDGHWDPYHRRAASAIEVEPRSSRIVSGTLGGSVVTERSSGELVVSKPVSSSTGNLPLFQPWSTPPTVRGERAVLAVETRPDSEQMFAWTRKAGPMVSPDRGLSWRKLELSGAFVSALEGALIDNFAVDSGERLYLTSHGFERNDPDQLWRSLDDAATWHAIFTFPGDETRVPVMVRRDDGTPAGDLFVARDGRLTRTTDGGDTWSALSGPWETGTIRAHSIRDSRHTVVYDLSHSSRVAFARPLSGRELELRSYTFLWPGGQVRPRSDVRDALTIDRITFVMTDGELYAGSIPQGETQLPHAPTIIAMLVFVVLLAALSFWYLRFEV